MIDRRGIISGMQKLCSTVHLPEPRVQQIPTLSSSVSLQLQPVLNLTSGRSHQNCLFDLKWLINKIEVVALNHGLNVGDDTVQAAEI